jgi:uncharacterized protein YutE (UPF0331/DUF86 family)
MTNERALLAEKASAVERHLKRVADKLPADVAQFQPGTDASDAVVLHLWQAVQIVIDLAVSQCVRSHLGTPQSYREAFERLARAGIVPADLAERLARAAGFRNVVAHAYENLDMKRVHAAATTGPGDLRTFLACLRDTA